MLLVASITGGVLTIIEYPHYAGASWPFTTTNAQSGPTPVLHDPSLNLMTAPISTYVVSENVTPVALTTPDGTSLVSGVDFDTSPINPIATSDIGDTTVNSPTDPGSKGSISTYVVKSGDSLSEIAQTYGVSVNTILWANNITNPSTIKQGTKLVILPVSGIQHTIRKGETLSTIAKKFGADTNDIAQVNGISADTALTTGSTIIIPGGELSSSEAKTVKSASSTSVKSSTHSSDSSISNTQSGAKMNFSDATGNPYRGGSGSALPGFFTNPLPGALLTQGLHGWNAVDLGAPTGTPIHAAAGGTVILSRTGGWNGGYGSYVILDNGRGIETLYAHMSLVKAQNGDTVASDQIIGYVGITGDATGPHLHFEVRGAQNPFSYCKENKVCSI